MGAAHIATPCSCRGPPTAGSMSLSCKTASTSWRCSTVRPRDGDQGERPASRQTARAPEQNCSPVTRRWAVRPTPPWFCRPGISLWNRPAIPQRHAAT